MELPSSAGGHAGQQRGRHLYLELSTLVVHDFSDGVLRFLMHYKLRNSIHITLNCSSRRLLERELGVLLGPGVRVFHPGALVDPDVMGLHFPRKGPHHQVEGVSLYRLLGNLVAEVCRRGT